MGTTETRAVIYCRISQDRTGGQAGVQRQEEDCRKLAAELGWTVVEVLVDNDTSAYGAKSRPGYDELIEALSGRRVGAVLAWHPDRLYRRMRDLEDLVDVVDKSGAKIATVRAGRVDLSTASGQLHARMLGSVAAYESGIKSERVTRAAEQRAKAGRFSGGQRPYGYEADGVTIRESEALHIRALFDDVLHGVSLREATRRRADAGALTATGKAWVSQHVRLIMLSPRVAGLAAYKGAVVGEAEWPAIVAETDWRAVRTILMDPARTTTPGPAPKHLLSGIAVCGRPDCGRRCRVSVTTRSASQERRYRYRCPRGHVIREQVALEAYVLAATFALLEANEVRPAVPDPTGSRDPGVEAETLRTRLEDLACDYADGLVTREQLTTVTGRVREQLDVLESAVVTTRRTSILDDVVNVPDVRAAWSALTIVRQRAILSQLWTVVLHPMPSGVRGVNERGVELVPQW